MTEAYSDLIKPVNVCAVADYLKTTFTQSSLGSNGSSFFILTDGTTVSSDSHETMEDALIYSDEYILGFGNHQYGVCVDKCSFIRCASADDYENYIELPPSVTSKQLSTLRDWIEWDMHFKFQHLQVMYGDDAQVYDLIQLEKDGEDVADYIISRIKRCYSSGRLYERATGAHYRNIKENNKMNRLREGSSDQCRTISPSEPIYRNFRYVARKLQTISVRGFTYRVDDCYLDYGSGWMWTTIIARDKKGNEHQILSPRDWKDIFNARSNSELDNIIREIMADEYFQDTESKKRFDEAITHELPDGTPNPLKTGASLKVGDVVYDENSNHKLEVVEVTDMTNYSRHITLKDIDTGKTEDRQVGNFSVFEVVVDGDVEVEVDDDIDFEFHPIDDYFGDED